MSANTFTTENVVLLGNSGVGKTYFLERYLNKADVNFNPSYAVGVDMRHIDMLYHGYKVTYKLWDTTGQQQYDEISKIYIRDKRCFIILYDVSNKDDVFRV
jgi:GTP-binding nuclear protein Ran